MAKARDKSFAGNLQAQIEAKPKLNAREKKILGVLKESPSPRRTRQINRWENHSRAAMDMDPAKGAIDWSAIDWAAILTTIIKLLFKLLL